MDATIQNLLSNSFYILILIVLLIGGVIGTYARYGFYWKPGIESFKKDFAKSSTFLKTFIFFIIAFFIFFVLATYSALFIKFELDKTIVDYHYYCEKLQDTNFKDESSRFLYESYFRTGGKKYDCTKPIKEEGDLKLLQNQYFFFGIITLFSTAVTTIYRMKLKK